MSYDYYDRIDEAERLADAVYGDPEAAPHEDRLAEAVKELAAEVRSLRHRIALLDGGDGIT